MRADVAVENEDDSSEDVAESEDEDEDEDEEEEDSDGLILPTHQRTVAQSFGQRRERGSFVYFEVFKDLPNPGLFIQGVGMIGFPLSEHDIEKSLGLAANRLF
jgi:hypothetical protein